MRPRIRLRIAQESVTFDPFKPTINIVSKRDFIYWMMVSNPKIYFNNFDVADVLGIDKFNAGTRLVSIYRKKHFYIRIERTLAKDMKGSRRKEPPLTVFYRYV